MGYRSSKGSTLRCLVLASEHVGDALRQPCQPMPLMLWAVLPSPPDLGTLGYARLGKEPVGALVTALAVRSNP